MRLVSSKAAGSLAWSRTCTSSLGANQDKDETALVALGLQRGPFHLVRPALSKHHHEAMFRSYPSFSDEAEELDIKASDSPSIPPKCPLSQILPPLWHSDSTINILH
jgi:hypothetical protein